MKNKLSLTSFAGTKFLEASVEITKEEYCKIRGWGIPADEDPKELGRLVCYPQPDGKPNNHPDYEGYVSWSPKFAFDAAYRENGNLTFGHAIEALKQGKRVAREGWNGKGMFVFMQVPSDINEGIVPNMQSLPQSVKDEFVRRFDEKRQVPLTEIHYRNQLAMVYPDNTIYGWLASPSDVLEEDWCILD